MSNKEEKKSLRVCLAEALVKSQVAKEVKAERKAEEISTPSKTRQAMTLIAEDITETTGKVGTKIKNLGEHSPNDILRGIKSKVTNVFSKDEEPVVEETTQEDMFLAREKELEAKIATLTEEKTKVEAENAELKKPWYSKLGEKLATAKAEG